MDIDPQVASGLVAARAVHFGACLLSFGLVAFDRWVAVPAMNVEPLAIAARWRKSNGRILAISLVLALFSGIAWFALNAITMSGMPPSEALQPEILKIVWTDTHFGKLCAIRSAIWLSAVAIMVCGLIAMRLRRFVAILRWLLLIATASLAGSLAWAGHGFEGNAPNVHLSADVLHILIGGVWPAGLLPFLMLLQMLRRSNDAARGSAIVRLTRRFSALSLTSVIVLTGTGIINAFFLIGSPADLLRTNYGKALSAKVLAFLVMVVLGALNLLRWKPRLSMNDEARAARAAGRLRVNVAVELALGALVIVLVGLLGILPPALHAAAHHHHPQ